ncbi:Leucine-rich repeat protein, putative, variant 2 [Balamuthia mandrillaris]
MAICLFGHSSNPISELFTDCFSSCRGTPPQTLPARRGPPRLVHANAAPPALFGAWEGGFPLACRWNKADRSSGKLDGGWSPDEEELELSLGQLVMHCGAGVTPGTFAPGVNSKEEKACYSLVVANEGQGKTTLFHYLWKSLNTFFATPPAATTLRPQEEGLHAMPCNLLRGLPAASLRFCLYVDCHFLVSSLDRALTRKASLTSQQLGRQYNQTKKEVTKKEEEAKEDTQKPNQRERELTLEMEALIEAAAQTWSSLKPSAKMNRGGEFEKMTDNKVELQLDFKRALRSLLADTSLPFILLLDGLEEVPLNFLHPLLCGLLQTGQSLQSKRCQEQIKEEAEEAEEEEEEEEEEEQEEKEEQEQEQEEEKVGGRGHEKEAKQEKEGHRFVWSMDSRTEKDGVLEEAQVQKTQSSKLLQEFERNVRVAAVSPDTKLSLRLRRFGKKLKYSLRDGGRLHTVLAACRYDTLKRLLCFEEPPSSSSTDLENTSNTSLEKQKQTGKERDQEPPQLQLPSQLLPQQGHPPQPQPQLHQNQGDLSTSFKFIAELKETRLRKEEKMAAAFGAMTNESISQWANSGLGQLIQWRVVKLQNFESDYDENMFIRQLLSHWGVYSSSLWKLVYNKKLRLLPDPPPPSASSRVACTPPQLPSPFAPTTTPFTPLQLYLLARECAMRGISRSSEEKQACIHSRGEGRGDIAQTLFEFYQHLLDDIVHDYLFHNLRVQTERQAIEDRTPSSCVLETKEQVFRDWKQWLCIFAFLIFLWEDERRTKGVHRTSLQRRFLIDSLQILVEALPHSSLSVRNGSQLLDELLDVLPQSFCSGMRIGRSGCTPRAEEGEEVPLSDHHRQDAHLPEQRPSLEVLSFKETLFQQFLVAEFLRDERLASRIFILLSSSSNECYQLANELKELPSDRPVDDERWWWGLSNTSQQRYISHWWWDAVWLFLSYSKGMQWMAERILQHPIRLYHECVSSAQVQQLATDGTVDREEDAAPPPTLTSSPFPTIQSGPSPSSLPKSTSNVSCGFYQTWLDLLRACGTDPHDLGQVRFSLLLRAKACEGCLFQASTGVAALDLHDDDVGGLSQDDGDSAAHLKATRDRSQRGHVEKEEDGATAATLPLKDVTQLGSTFWELVLQSETTLMHLQSYPVYLQLNYCLGSKMVNKVITKCISVLKYSHWNNLDLFAVPILLKFLPENFLDEAKISQLIALFEEEKKRDKAKQHSSNLGSVRNTKPLLPTQGSDPKRKPQETESEKHSIRIRRSLIHLLWQINLRKSSPDLENINNFNIIHLIIDLLKDSDGGVQREATLIMKELGKLSLLQLGTKQREFFLKQLLRLSPPPTGTSTVTPCTVMPLSYVFESFEWKQLMNSALKMMKMFDLYEWLLRWVGSEDAGLRLLVFTVLGTLGDTLLPTRQRTDPERVASCQVLAMLSQAYQPSYPPALLKRLKDIDRRTTSSPPIFGKTNEERPFVRAFVSVAFHAFGEGAAECPDVASMMELLQCKPTFMSRISAVLLLKMSEEQEGLRQDHYSEGDEREKTSENCPETKNNGLLVLQKLMMAPFDVAGGEGGPKGDFVEGLNNFVIKEILPLLRLIPDHLLSHSSEHKFSLLSSWLLQLPHSTTSSMQTEANKSITNPRTLDTALQSHNSLQSSIDLQLLILKSLPSRFSLSMEEHLFPHTCNTHLNYLFLLLDVLEKHDRASGNLILREAIIEKLNVVATNQLTQHITHVRPLSQQLTKEEVEGEEQEETEAAADTSCCARKNIINALLTARAELARRCAKLLSHRSAWVILSCLRLLFVLNDKEREETPFIISHYRKNATDTGPLQPSKCTPHHPSIDWKDAVEQMLNRTLIMLSETDPTFRMEATSLLNLFLNNTARHYHHKLNNYGNTIGMNIRLEDEHIIALCSLLKSPLFAIRATAVTALGMFCQTTAVVPTLPQRPTKQPLFAGWQKRIEHFLLQILREESNMDREGNDAVQESTVRALCFLRENISDEGLATVASLLNAKSRLRIVVLEALASFGRRSLFYIPCFIEFLKSENPCLRETAAHQLKVLASYLPFDEEHIAQLGALLRGTSDVAKMPRHSSGTPSLSDGDQSFEEELHLPDFEESDSDDDAFVREEALGVLMKLGPQTLILFVHDIMDILSNERNEEGSLYKACLLATGLLLQYLHKKEVDLDINEQRLHHIRYLLCAMESTHDGWKIAAMQPVNAVHLSLMQRQVNEKLQGVKQRRLLVNKYYNFILPPIINNSLNSTIPMVKKAALKILRINPKLITRFHYTFKLTKLLNSFAEDPDNQIQAFMLLAEACCVTITAHLNPLVSLLKSRDTKILIKTINLFGRLRSRQGLTCALNLVPSAINHLNSFDIKRRLLSLLVKYGDDFELQQPMPQQATSESYQHELHLRKQEVKLLFSKSKDASLKGFAFQVLKKDFLHDIASEQQLPAEFIKVLISMLTDSSTKNQMEGVFTFAELKPFHRRQILPFLFPCSSASIPSSRPQAIISSSTTAFSCFSFPFIAGTSHSDSSDSEEQEENGQDSENTPLSDSVILWQLLSMHWNCLITHTF